MFHVREALTNILWMLCHEGEYLYGHTQNHELYRIHITNSRFICTRMFHMSEALTNILWMLCHEGEYLYGPTQNHELYRLHITNSLFIRTRMFHVREALTNISWMLCQANVSWMLRHDIYGYIFAVTHVCHDIWRLQMLWRICSHICHGARFMRHFVCDGEYIATYVMAQYSWDILYVMANI